MDATHRPNKGPHHREEEGEDGHQHAGLAEPPEDPRQGGPLPPSSLQLIAPQSLEPATRNQRHKKNLNLQLDLHLVNNEYRHLVRHLFCDFIVAINCVKKCVL